MGEMCKRHTWIKHSSGRGIPQQSLNTAVRLQRSFECPYPSLIDYEDIWNTDLISPSTPRSGSWAFLVLSLYVFSSYEEMNYRHVKENGNVVVYLVLLLGLTFTESVTACEYSSITSYFNETLYKVIHVLINDYEVPVVSNFEQDNHCLDLWRAHDTYTMLKVLNEKTQNDLKERIEKLLEELSFVKDCQFQESEICTKHNQTLVKVLQQLNAQQLENISGNHFRCTSIRCVSGSTIAPTDQPIVYHDNVTTNYSSEWQDAGSVPNNEEYLQQKRSEPSNKHALSQDDKTHTPQTGRNRLFVFVSFILFILLLAIFLQRGKHQNMDPQNENQNNADIAGIIIS
ncbi:fms-related tyrosine kinase 3 ligand isoform X2 [Pyxicephalus adspersus]|uniref:fms-related tyrosine kinase 3 ligand isoform X2 n=1 Tax=Pyxicephalus adspersus TaxID=30357 RepID=UPI003B5C2C0D